MKLIILLFLIIIRMGFYLLIERKLMGLLHYRLGPNKVLFIGLIQFIFDLIKLVFKEYKYMYIIKINYLFIIILILFISFVF